MAEREAEELRRGAGAEEGILDLKEDDLRLEVEMGLMDPLTAPFLEEAIAINIYANSLLYCVALLC